jgi:hypothetical protein
MLSFCEGHLSFGQNVVVRTQAKVSKPKWIKRSARQRVREKMADSVESGVGGLRRILSSAYCIFLCKLMEREYVAL